MVVVTNKQLLFLIPCAVNHFLFHFFPRRLPAFSSGLSAQHPILSLYQDVNHCVGQNYWCPLQSGGLKESQLSSNKEELTVNVAFCIGFPETCGSENSVAQRRLDANNWFDYHKLCTFFSNYLINSKITIPRDLWLNV